MPVLNLPVTLDSALPGDLLIPTLPVASVAFTPDRQPQAFDDILAGMIEKNTADTEDTPSPALAFPIGTLVASIATGMDLLVGESAPDTITTGLSGLPPMDGHPNANQPATFTSLPVSWSSTNLPQAVGQFHAADMPADTLSTDINRVVTAPENGHDRMEVADSVIFADNGKSLLLSITPTAAHTNNALAADTTSGTTNNMPAVTTEFGHPNWPDEFGQKITWIATQRLQFAELKLYRPIWAR